METINKEPYTLELTEKIQISLNKETFSKLQEIAEIEKRPLSSVARTIITEYFKK